MAEELTAHQRWLKERQEELTRAIQQIMSTRQGRSVMWWLLQSSGLNDASFTGDALRTAFNEGKRSFAIQLAQKLKAGCPTEYVHMWREEVEAGLLAPPPEPAENDDE